MDKKLIAASLGGIVLTGVMAVGQSAVAAALCTEVTSLSAWAEVGSCDLGDKTWTFGSSSLLEAGGDASAKFDLVETAKSDFYRLLLQDFDDNGGGATSDDGFIIGELDGIVAYTIAIRDDPATPEDERYTRYFKSAALDSDTVSTGNLVEKDGKGFRDNEDGSVTDGDSFTLVSTNGDKDVKECSTCKPNRIVISDLRAETTAAIQTISDEYEQAAIIPEPGTLALFGLGLAGVGFFGRRRKA